MIANSISAQALSSESKRPNRKMFSWLPPLALGLLCALQITVPVNAAERIRLTYGPFILSVRVSSLETFAQDGTIDNNLAFFLSRATPEQQAKFREALTKRVDVSPVLLSRFFKTEIGEDILNRIGRMVTIPGGSNGKYALRGAIVKAAFEPEGLTLLRMLQQFPTDIQLQGELLVELAQAVDLVVRATFAFTEVMEQLSAKEAAQEPQVNFSQLPDIRQPGQFAFQKETFTLTHSNRDAEGTLRARDFYVILYTPKQWRAGKTPVVVLSHGLASRPEDFESTAQYLASYGYVVALPQHPGSDLQQAQDLLAGLSREVFELNEFINRPKDISAVIDELERRNQTQYNGRLDLENVGVAGHSFGGFGALAVAGAEFDFDYLQIACNRPFSGLNTSLLLQCRALSLPPQIPSDFRDPRVKAVIGANPVNSSIFGQKGISKIQIPVLFLSGNYDPATPAVFEQLRSFVWLTTPDKYLALAEGQAHVDFSNLDANLSQALKAIPDLTLPEPSLLKSYTQPMALAFFEIYLANNAQFKPYLTSSYLKYLSQEQPFQAFLISTFSEPALIEAIEDFRAREGKLIQ